MLSINLIKSIMDEKLDGIVHKDKTVVFNHGHKILTVVSANTGEILMQVNHELKAIEIEYIDTSVEYVEILNSILRYFLVEGYQFRIHSIETLNSFYDVSNANDYDVHEVTEENEISAEEGQKIFNELMDLIFGK